MFAEEEAKDEVVEEEVEEKEEVKETPEQELERLKSEKVVWEEKEKQLSHDQSALGRRYKELQEGQESTQSTVRQLEDKLERMNVSKEDAGLLDLSDPNEANKWFDKKVNERVSKDNKEQKEFDTQYEKDVDKILNNRDVGAEEREYIMAGLEKERKNMFDDTKLSAEVNINKVSGDYWREKATGGGTKNLNLKKDKAVGTGVGGGGTVEQTKKKVADTPEMTKLKGAFAMEKSIRGW